MQWQVSGVKDVSTISVVSDKMGSSKKGKK
jgi:hypothetical protein